jgi:hypothetical protein
METCLIPPKKHSLSALNMPEPTGLSILIPVYNYDVRPLVNALIEQGGNINIPFELLCFDDGSSEHYKKINREIDNLKNTIYKELPENIGRSKIRNKLALASKYAKLLFLDCDSGIVKKDFLENYLAHEKEGKILIGGTVYGNKAPKEYSLRWKFGKIREERTAAMRALQPFQSIHINNLLADKNIYLQHQLDENMITYGHEDTKLGYSLKSSGVSIKHIDNPVEHCGLEPNEVFLEKTKEGIKNFYKLLREGYGKDTKLYKSFATINIFPFRSLFCFYYNLRENSIRKNLLSDNPSLLNFDLYKLMLLLKESKKRQS